MMTHDTMVALFQNMAVTGTTPWQKFKEAVADAAKMEITAKYPQMLMTGVWDDIAKRFIVPDTLPNLMEDEQGVIKYELSSRLAELKLEGQPSSKKRCMAWMKHINDNARKYPSHSDDRFVLSRRIIIKANGIFSELKELKHLYPDHWMLREDEEVREWHENEPYKAIWSHVQFLVRMGHLVTQSAMFHLLNMAVEYPFDAEEATTLVESWKMRHGNWAVAFYLSTDSEEKTNVSAWQFMNSGLLHTALSGGNEAIKFVLNIYPGVSHKEIERVLMVLVEYPKEKHNALKTDAMEMLQTLRSSKNWKFDFGDQGPTLMSWSDFEDGNPTWSLQDPRGFESPNPARQFYEIVKNLFRVLEKAITTNVSADFFKALASAYLERISAVFSVYDAKTLGKPLLRVACKSSTAPGIILAIKEMQWGEGEFSREFDNNFDLQNEFFTLVVQENPQKVEMLEQLKTAFPSWWESSRFKRVLQRYVEAQLSTTYDRNVAQWIVANVV